MGWPADFDYTHGDDMNFLQRMAQATKPRTSRSVSNSDLIRAKGHLEKISRDFKETSSQQNQARKTVATLSKTIARMESDLRSFERLKSENNTLISARSDLSRQLDQKSSWASEIEAKFTTLEKQNQSLRKDLDAAKADIAARKDQQANIEDKLAAQSALVVQYSSEISTHTDVATALDSRAKRYQDELSARTAETAELSRKTLELEGTIDALTAKLNLRTQQHDAAIVDIKELRLNHNELRTKYIETSGTLDNLSQESASQKSIFEDTIGRRTEENLALKSRIEQINTQLRVKDNMRGHITEELTALRRAAEAAEAARAESDMRLRDKQVELHRNSDALLKAKSDFETLNAKFAQSLDDIETLRKINQAQQQKLERYASIGGVSAGQVLKSSNESLNRYNESRILGAATSPTGSPRITPIKIVK